MRDKHRKNTKPRRSVLKKISAGSVGAVLGGAAIPGVAVGAEHEYQDLKPLPESPDMPEPKTPAKIRDFDPYNPNQVIGMQKMYSKSNTQKREKIMNRLNGTQKEALIDAFRPAYRSKVSGKASEPLPEDRPIGELYKDPGVEILSKDAEWVRKDIGKKWRWFE